MTDKQNPWCIAYFLWEAWENNFPSSLLPIPSPAIRRSRVSLDALQQKSHVQRTLSLSCAALHYTPFIIINTRNCGTALVNEKSPFLTSRGCQPTLFSLSAEAEFVSQVGGCWLSCVCPLPPAHPDRTAAAPLLLPAGTHRAALRKAGPELVSARQRIQGAKAVAFLPHTGKDVLLGPTLLEMKELLEVEGAGEKDNSFQLVSSSVSPDQ